MADIRLNEFGDLDLSTGGLVMENGTEQEYLQRINQFVNMNIGNWFADPRFGMPYIENEYTKSYGLLPFLSNGKDLPPSFIFKTMRDRIALLQYVTDIDGDYEFDKASRKISITFYITINNTLPIVYNI